MYVWHINVILQLEICGDRVCEKAAESLTFLGDISKEKKMNLYELALLPLDLAGILPYRWMGDSLEVWDLRHVPA